MMSPHCVNHLGDIVTTVSRTVITKKVGQVGQVGHGLSDQQLRPCPTSFGGWAGWAEGFRSRAQKDVGPPACGMARRRIGSFDLSLSPNPARLSAFSCQSGTGSAVMDDAELVEQTALEYIRLHGEEALAKLLERAEIDAQIGDEISTRAWRDIADCVRLLMEHGHGVVRAGVGSDRGSHRPERTAHHPSARANRKASRGGTT